MSFFFTGGKTEGQPTGQNFSSMFDSVPASDNFMFPSSDNQGPSSDEGGLNFTGSVSSPSWKKPVTSSTWAPTPSSSSEFKIDRPNRSTFSSEFKLSSSGKSLDTPKKLAVVTSGGFVEDNRHNGGSLAQGSNIGLEYSLDGHMGGKQAYVRESIGGSQTPQMSPLFGRHIEEECHIGGGQAQNSHIGGRTSEDSLVGGKQGQGCHVGSRKEITSPESHDGGDYLPKAATSRKEGARDQFLPPVESEGSLKRRVSEQLHDIPKPKHQHLEQEGGKQVSFQEDHQQQQYLGDEKAGQVAGGRSSGGEEDSTKSSVQDSVLEQVEEKDMYASGDLPSSEEILTSLLEQQRVAVGSLLPGLREEERRELEVLDRTRQVCRDIQEYSTKLVRIKDQYRKKLIVVSAFLGITPGQE